MDPATVLDLLNEIESSFPVLDWVIDDVHVWPVVRLRLAFDLNEFYATPESTERGFAGQLRGKLSFAREASAGAIRRLGAILVDPRGERLKARPADVLLLGYGWAATPIGDGWMDRVCDPVAACFREHGLATLSLRYQHEYRVPRVERTGFIQPALDWAVLRRRRVRPDSQLEGYDELRQWIAARRTGTVLPSRRELVDQMAVIRSMERVFRRWLVRTSASVGLTASYYGPAGMAFDLACRSLKIPSVDVQHGFGGDMHFAYSRWNAVPSTGFAVLPSIFWCWDDSDVASIERWGGTAIRGGNTFLARWRTGLVPGAERLRAEVAARAQSDARRNVLWTLTPTLERGEHLAMMIEVVRKTQDTWRWWIRAHPTMLDQLPSCIRELTGIDVRAIESDLANTMPLYAVLDAMDRHVTHSSSVVIEARAMEVPSIITSEYGWKAHGPSIHQGWATVQLDAPTITSALQATAIRSRSLPSSLEACAGVDALREVVPALRR